MLNIDWWNALSHDDNSVATDVIFLTPFPLSQIKCRLNELKEPLTFKSFQVFFAIHSKWGGDLIRATCPLGLCRIDFIHHFGFRGHVHLLILKEAFISLIEILWAFCISLSTNILTSFCWMNIFNSSIYKCW